MSRRPHRVGRPTGSLRAGVLEYLSISNGVLVLDNCDHLLAEVAQAVVAAEVLLVSPPPSSTVTR